MGWIILILSKSFEQVFLEDRIDTLVGLYDDFKFFPEYRLELESYYSLYLDLVRSQRVVGSREQDYMTFMVSNLYKHFRGDL